ncbi:ribokinase [Ruania alba]|uniref:Ribokinase n=1 Tax=Ruania alba TaxID=648782 RepID=A0A1H5CPC7_9MICO|nr:ribokinase [Ruania alba]SED68579.1 6-phosphofructokinase [Ruania alba]
MNARVPDSGVLVVGSATIDVTARSARSPRPGETVRGGGSTLVPGGKGANQAIASAASGAPTYFVGCVGTDAFGTMINDELSDHRIDLSHLIPVEGPTGLAHIRVTEDGENDIVIVPNANAALTVENVDTAVASTRRNCRVLLTQLETPLDIVAHTLQCGRSAGLTTILDPAPAAPLPEKIWALVDIVTPNETEATELTGIQVTDVESAVTAGHWFTAHGVGTAIITRAGDGAVVVTKSDSHALDAQHEIVVVDTTAAGDAFAGYLAGSLAAGLTPDDAVRRGMAAGTLAVTVAGASPSIPTAGDVDALLDRGADRDLTPATIQGHS